MNLSRHPIFLCVIFASHLVSGQTSWPPELLTIPETSQFLKTSTHSEVIKFLDELQSRSKEIHVISMGNSLEGKSIPVAVLSRQSVKTAKEANASGKPVIYIQGNIHSGEVEGKEAVLMLMREILLGDKSYLLDNQIILFAPIYNTDSNDKMEAGRRPSQENSPLEAGLRENSAGLDLNRDGTKMEALETQALFSNIVSQWDPQVFVDLHTTNGTWHAYSLTWAPGYHTAGDSATYNYTQKMLRLITSEVKEKYGLFLGPYGEYRLDEGWPPKNFYTYNHHPRYLVNQFGLRNRMAILSEAFSHERFYQRINSTYHFVAEILDYTHKKGYEIQSINKKSQEAAIRNVVENAGKIKKGVRFKMISGEVLNGFRTYDYVSSTNSEGTSEWIRTGKIVSYNDVNYHASFQPVIEAMLPRGYVIPAAFSGIAELLRTHGVTVSQLTKQKVFSGELFNIARLEKADRIFEGHYLARAEGSFVAAKQRFKKGDYVVDMAQPLANLIFYLLEPQSDDGFVNWNFFDSYFESENLNNKPVQYPVFKYIH